MKGCVRTFAVPMCARLSPTSIKGLEDPTVWANCDFLCTCRVIRYVHTRYGLANPHMHTHQTAEMLQQKRYDAAAVYLRTCNRIILLRVFSHLHIPSYVHVIDSRLGAFEIVVPNDRFNRILGVCNSGNLYLYRILH